MLSRAALRNLMGQAASAGSLQTVYQTALRCVQEALAVERASLLVFDAHGMMRFVAWSGLSDEYRAAVDGHSPWLATETNAAPIMVPDIDQDASLTDYMPVFRRESIRALAFIPLQFGQKLLGKFMLYYREPHAFGEGEVEVAQQIADHVAFALEHHRIAVALEARLVTERDLRHRAESEAALRRANESRLHLALGAGRMGAWDWDIRTNRVQWSPELEVIHGLEPGTFGGTLDAFRRDMHPADVAGVEAAIKKALAAPGTDYAIDYRIELPDGVVRWMSASGRVLADDEGAPVRMVGVCRDVTERKRAEEASAFLVDVSRMLATTLDPAEALEQLARRVVPGFADFCVTYGFDGATVRALGYAHCDPSKTPLVAALAHDVPVSVEDRNGPGMVIRRGEPCVAREIIPDPSKALAAAAPDAPLHLALEPRSVMFVPLNARGRTVGAIGFAATDDSGRRFGDEDLKVATELAARAALLVDNARLYAEAQSAVRARDDMIAVVSHDLRDPLQSIAAAAATLRRAHTLEDAESIDSIVLASTQMRLLVQDLLDISRIDAGRLPITKEKVDLNDLMNEAEMLFQPQVEGNALQLRRVLAPNLPPVLIDRHRILQALSNLIGNALKFATPGGVITLGAEWHNDRVRVWVRDTGVGIPVDQLERVFERFWSADRRAGGGAGLGLAVAKGIVEAHGGRIGVESRLGVGSTFYFTVHPYVAVDREIPQALAVAAERRAFQA